MKANKSPLDVVRRRRWHRELIAAPGTYKTLADLPTNFDSAGTFHSYQGFFLFFVLYSLFFVLVSFSSVCRVIDC